MKAERPLRNKLKQARLRMGLSQQDLAQHIGVTRQTISAIESGTMAPSTTVALGLAHTLGCQVEDLFWLEGDTMELDATLVSDVPITERSVRCTVAEIGGRWLAYPLLGQEAFRSEFLPADGVSTMVPSGKGEETHTPTHDDKVERHDAIASNIRVRLLDNVSRLSRTVVVAGCLPELSLWIRAAERSHPGLRVHWLYANSTDALHKLDRGEVHAAGIHYYDELTGEHNVPLVRRLLPHRDIILVNLGIWEEGLLVRPGNPYRISDVADLAQPGIRIINREEGAGSRFLLQQRLDQAHVPIEEVDGFSREVTSHFDVAKAVASGEADSGVSTASVAAAFDLDFIPLQQVRYDLAVPEPFLEDQWVKQLLGALGHRWVLSQLAALGGYDTRQSGEVMATIKADKVRQGS